MTEKREAQQVKVKLTIGFEIVGKDTFGPIARMETVEYIPSPYAQQTENSLRDAILHFLTYTQDGWQSCCYEGLDGLERYMHISDYAL